MRLDRRGFLTGLGAAFVAAPAVIRTPGLLMPVKPVIASPHVFAPAFTETICGFYPLEPYAWDDPISYGPLQRHELPNPHTIVG